MANHVLVADSIEAGSHTGADRQGDPRGLFQVTLRVRCVCSVLTDHRQLHSIHFVSIGTGRVNWG